MKKLLLSLAAVAALSANAQSLNITFTGDPVEVGVCTYDYDMENNGTTNFGLTPSLFTLSMGDEQGDAKALVANPEATNGMAGGVFAYGSGAWLGGKDYTVPAEAPADSDNENALGILAVWTASAQYLIENDLDAGIYTLTFCLQNTAGNAAPAKSLFGFIADNGMEYLASAKVYPVGEWTYETVTFTLDEAAHGNISLGYVAPNSGSGANQHLFIDNVTLSYEELPEPADLTALNQALTDAEQYALGFEEGEYAPYTNVEAILAVEAAKALLANAPIFDQDAVDEAAAAVNNATWTANASALNAIHNGNFHLSEPDGPAPYWSNVAEGGYGKSRVFVYAEPTEESTEAYVKNYEALGALQPGEGTRAALYLRYYENPGAWYNYGNAAGYTMPLEGMVKYHFTCDFGQWGEGDGENTIQIYDADGKCVLDYTGYGAHIDAGGEATHVSLEFTPSVSGNCRLSLWSKGDKKHYAVFSNFVIERAADISGLLGEYTVDSFDGFEWGLYSDADTWIEFSHANYEAGIAAGEEDNQVIIYGFVYDVPEVAVFGNVNPYEKTITIPAQPVYFYDEAGEVVKEYIFCNDTTFDWGFGTPDGDVVAEYDDDYYIVLSDFTLVADNGEEAEDNRYESCLWNTDCRMSKKGFDSQETIKIEGNDAIDAAPIFYNLQGVRVANPAAGQLYIVVKGSKSFKTIIR